MGLVDGPLDLTHPDARDLIDFLRKTFQSKAEVRGFALEAGVDLGYVDLEQPVAYLWQDVTITAARQKSLRRLIERVIVNPNSAQGRIFLYRLLGEPADTDAVAPSPGPDPNPPPIPDDIFETALLWDDLPFIDRSPLRTNLKQ
ncbi:MAG TPA: effector-associated domain EAD1-containing protein, partial [Intrasporangium sp.]|nr:effector-associated domain EAD1-containing protein [Intrasporangium sp.]